MKRMATVNALDTSLKSEFYGNWPRKFYIASSFAIFLIIVTSCLFIFGDVDPYLIFKNIISKGRTSRNTEDTTAALKSITLTATNEYGKYSAPYTWLDDGVLIEPYKSTILTIDGDGVELFTKYTWLITSENGFSGMVVSSMQPFISITLNKTGTYTLTVQKDTWIADSVVSFTKNLYVKYVKRELRSLNTKDREKLLDAMWVMWKVDTKTGKSIYGEKYTSIDTFVDAHAASSNNIMCDSFHDGSGFIPHHLALTNSFDASLRAINPEVTLPYWDFSVEGQIISDANSLPSHLLDVSPIFTDEWFGSVDSSYHIQDSRWAHTNITVAGDKTMCVPNSFGFIRSYWNNNNDPQVVRRLFDVCGYEATSKKVPNCQSHFTVLNSPTLGYLQLIISPYGHGPMHVHVGGVGGDCVQSTQTILTKWQSLLEEDLSDEYLESVGINITTWKWGNIAPRKALYLYQIPGSYFHFYKALWRSHLCSRDNTPQLLHCPEKCDPSMTMEECKCTIPAYINGETDSENVMYCVILNAAERDTFLKVFPQEFIDDLVMSIATTSVYEGEMMESASPSDAIFWVIHPTLERLLMAKRMERVYHMAHRRFYKWDPVDGSDEEWLSYSTYSIKPGVNKLYPTGYTCPGHDANSKALPEQLPYIEGFSEYADLNGDGSVSNWEYILATDPEDPDGLDYVYDNYVWEHCIEAIGGDDDVGADVTGQSW